MPRRAVPALFAAVLLAGCPGSIDDPSRFYDTAGICPESFDVEEDLFARTCGTLGCHTGGPLAAAGLDLTTEGVADRIVAHTSMECGDRALVTEGSLDDSYLLEKVGPEPECGERMPADMPALNPTEQACLRAYVAGLAGVSTDAGVPPPRDGGSPVDEDAGPAGDDGGPAPSAVTIEAESMTLSGYEVDAAMMEWIRLADGTATGSATTSFEGGAGTYGLVLTIVLEPDGQPTLRVFVDGAMVHTESYALASGADPETATVDVGDVTLAAGDEIRLEGDGEGDAWARVDRLELTP